VFITVNTCSGLIVAADDLIGIMARINNIKTASAFLEIVLIFIDNLLS